MEQKDYRLAAIMYTDISGFSRMMERDESGTLELLKFHNDLIGEIVVRHHGSIIKTIGDALLVDFKNTVEAMQSALEIQDKLYAHNKERARLPLLVRIGLHLGDIYFFENDALGEGINIAARLQSLARPGCICFSQDVYNLVLNKIEFRAEKLGKVSLKNITKEIHAYEITTPNVEFDPERDKPRAGYMPGSYLDDDESSRTVASTMESGRHDGPAWASSKEPLAAVPIPPPAASPPPIPRLPTLTPQAAALSAAAPAAKIAADGLRPAANIAADGLRPAANIAAEGLRPAAKIAADGLRPAANIAADGLRPAANIAADRLSQAREADRSYSEEASRSLLAEIRKAILEDIKTEGKRMTVEEARERYGFYGVEAQEVIASLADQGLLVRARRGPATLLASELTGRPASSDIGKTIEAAVHGIVSEIERSVEQNMGNRAAEHRWSGMDRMRFKIERKRDRLERKAERLGGRRAWTTEDSTETGRWDRQLDKDEAWKEGPESQVDGFHAYRDRLERKAKSARGGFIGNFVSWLGVNGFLWFLNLTTSPSFHWAAIVTAAWGIGVASSAAAAWRGGVKVREIENLPELDRGQLDMYKKLNRVKDSIVQHGTSAVTVSILLAQINLMTDTRFLWFLIPSAALGISFLSHLLAFTVSKPRLEREFKKSLGVEGGWRRVFSSTKEAKATTENLGPYASLYREAEKAKAAIIEQTRGQGTEDLTPALTEYVSQVKLLAESANEIDRIVDAIPMGALSTDKAALLIKEGRASTPAMKAEYRKSIQEIERQEGSWEDLKNQSEVIRLRLGSSVNQLKQMRIDIARLKAAGETGPAAESNLGTLRTRTEELSRYLEDLRKGYDESRKDPFAELEAAERLKAELGDREGSDEDKNPAP